MNSIGPYIAKLVLHHSSYILKINSLYPIIKAAKKTKLYKLYKKIQVKINYLKHLASQPKLYATTTLTPSSTLLLFQYSELPHSLYRIAPK
jgi:hypothetical protein